MARKQQKIIVLRVPRPQLAEIAGIPEQPSTPSSEAPSPAPTPNGTNGLKPTDSMDHMSETNSTPVPLDGSMNTESGKKRKAPPPGNKKGTPNAIDGQPKPRGKPGPKKKPRK
jgi:hypothetical protein